MIQKDQDVYTPLGKGSVVHVFRDGTFAVELAHGGGHIFRADELFGMQIDRTKTHDTREGIDRQVRRRYLP